MENKLLSNVIITKWKLYMHRFNFESKHLYGNLSSKYGHNGNGITIENYFVLSDNNKLCIQI